MQGDVEPVAPIPSAPPADEPKKKKKKKRKRDNGEKVSEERECVVSHLEASSTQEEDWCQAGMWSLTPGANAGQSEEKSQRATALSAENPEQRESEQKEPGQDSLKKKKKKKKMKLMQDLQKPSSAGSTSERWVKLIL